MGINNVVTRIKTTAGTSGYSFFAQDMASMAVYEVLRASRGINPKSGDYRVASFLLALAVKNPVKFGKQADRSLLDKQLAKILSFAAPIGKALQYYDSIEAIYNKYGDSAREYGTPSANKVNSLANSLLKLGERIDVKLFVNAYNPWPISMYAPVVASVLLGLKPPKEVMSVITDWLKLQRALVTIDNSGGNKFLKPMENVALLLSHNQIPYEGLGISRVNKRIKITIANIANEPDSVQQLINCGVMPTGNDGRYYAADETRAILLKFYKEF